MHEHQPRYTIDRDIDYLGREWWRIVDHDAGDVGAWTGEPFAIYDKAVAEVDRLRAEMSKS